jgi:hypothetical protein
VDALAPLTPEESDTLGDLFSVWLGSPFAGAYPLHEVAYAYDVETDTARVLPRASHRDYASVQPGEIPGTADLVHVGADRVTVADVKSGFQPHIEPVEQHRQLRFLALAAARAYMVDAATIQILHINDGKLRATEATLNAGELDAIAAEVRRLHRAIPEAQPRPGRHCTESWCPALAVCPSTQALAATVATEAALPPPHKLSVTVDSDEHALWMAAAVPAAQKFLDAVNAAWKAHVKAKGGIALPNGKVFRQVDPMERVTMTGRGAAEAEDRLVQLGLGDAIERKTTVSVSKESLREAAKKMGLAGRELTAKVEEAMGVLRAADCVRETPVEKYAERKS